MIKHSLILLSLTVFPLISMMAQKGGKSEIMVQTSAQCEMCKNRIEKALAFEKGVIRSNLDLETKIVTVQFKVDKTSVGKIREAIAAVGYDADDVPANPEAYKNLPPCCKKPDDPDHIPH